MESASYAGWRGGRRCRDVAMVDKIEVTVHVTINGMYFPRNLDCTDDLLQTVADFTHPSDLSRDATHVIYARLHNEEWISNGHMLHSISSECISMRLFCYSNIPRRRSLTATSSPSTDGPTTGSSLLLLFLWWDRRSHLYWN